MNSANQIMDLSTFEINQVNGRSPTATGLAIAGYLGAAFAWGFSAGRDFALYLNKRK